MRTSTPYFARKMLEDLLAIGLVAEKAEMARDEILKNAEAKGWPMVSWRATARIGAYSTEVQSVYVDDEGLAVLHTRIAREHQPLIAIQSVEHPKIVRMRVREEIQRKAA